MPTRIFDDCYRETHEVDRPARIRIPRVVSLKRRFIQSHYSSNTAYLKARREDYLKVQFEWSCWIDMMCKTGQITQKQYDNAIF